MYRLLTTLSVVAGLGGVTSSAQADPVVFKGTCVVESVSTACGAALTKILQDGHCEEVRYRAASLGTNGNASHFFVEINGQAGGYLSSFKRDSGGLTSTFQTVGGLRIALGEETPILDYTAQMRLLNQQPSTLANTTKFVTMRAQIKNFGDIAQCVVTFRAALVGIN